MVKLLSTQTIQTKEGVTPVMHRHNLLVKKSAPTFEEGQTITCWIAKYDHGRYAVFTASFIEVPNYHVFDSEDQLHEHFEEQL